MLRTYTYQMSEIEQTENELCGILASFLTTAEQKRNVIFEFTTTLYWVVRQTLSCNRETIGIQVMMPKVQCHSSCIFWIWWITYLEESNHWLWLRQQLSILLSSSIIKFLGPWSHFPCPCLGLHYLIIVLARYIFEAAGMIQSISNHSKFESLHKKWKSDIHHYTNWLGEFIDPWSCRNLNFNLETDIVDRVIDSAIGDLFTQVTYTLTDQCWSHYSSFYLLPPFLKLSFVGKTSGKAQ